MTKRININEIEPAAFKAMYALEAYLAQSGLSKSLKELIKIRASQINGCAYCIDMHTKDALKNGESVQRLLLISAWREAKPFFTEQEQAILAMTEELTLVHRSGLSEETYQSVVAHFSEAEVARIMMVIVTINAWNRIAVGTHQEIPE